MFDQMSWALAWPWIALAFSVGFAIGSIPTGVLLSRAFGLGDLTKIGSGNIGATNVARTGNMKAAALTLVLDMAKGAVAVLVMLQFGGEASAEAAGIGAVIGHCLTPWLRFKGGKGVATFLGMVIALNPLSGLMTCVTWSFFFGWSRISSVAGMAAAAAAPAWIWLHATGNLALSVAIPAVWVILRHHQNIARLLRGQEPRSGPPRKS